MDEVKDNGAAPEQPVKRGRGRPRIHPPKDPNAPKRPRGRPPGSKSVAKEPGRPPLSANGHSLAAPSVSKPQPPRGEEVWAAWGHSPFLADVAIVAISQPQGPDVSAALTLYFEVWNLVRHLRRLGRTERLEDIAAQYLPRSFAWLRDSLRWVELLLACPDWTVSKLSAFLSQPKAERLGPFLAANPTANPNVAFNVALQKYLEAEAVHWEPPQLALWAAMAEDGGPFLPWAKGKPWLLALVKASRPGIAGEIAAAGARAWPSAEAVAQAKEQLAGPFARLVESAQAAGDYPKADAAVELMRKGGKLAELELIEEEEAPVPKAAKHEGRNGHGQNGAEEGAAYDLGPGRVEELRSLLKGFDVDTAEDGVLRIRRGDAAMRLTDKGELIQAATPSATIDLPKAGRWEQFKYAVLGLATAELGGH